MRGRAGVRRRNVRCHENESRWYGSICRDGVIGDGSHSLHRAGVE